MAVDDRLQFDAVDRLGEKVAHSTRQAVLPVLGKGIGRQRDDGRVLVRSLLSADRLGRLDPVHARHCQVHEYDVVALACRQLDRGLAVFSNLDAAA